MSQSKQLKINSKKNCVDKRRLALDCMTRLNVDAPGFSAGV